MVLIVIFTKDARLCYFPSDCNHHQRFVPIESCHHAIQMIQSYVIRWALGCVNLLSVARESQTAGLATQGQPLYTEGRKEGRTSGFCTSSLNSLPMPTFSPHGSHSRKVTRTGRQLKIYIFDLPTYSPLLESVAQISMDKTWIWRENIDF